jgi:hypothetical protein
MYGSKLTHGRFSGRWTDDGACGDEMSIVAHCGRCDGQLIGLNWSMIDDNLFNN